MPCDCEDFSVQNTLARRMRPNSCLYCFFLRQVECFSICWKQPRWSVPVGIKLKRRDFLLYLKKASQQQIFISAPDFFWQVKTLQISISVAFCIAFSASHCLLLGFLIPPLILKRSPLLMSQFRSLRRRWRDLPCRLEWSGSGARVWLEVGGGRCVGWAFLVPRNWYLIC